MKLDYNLLAASKSSAIRIGKRNAYHLAGRIAAIHLGNAQKKLPAVHFQVVIKLSRMESEFNNRLARIHRKSMAILEGGRLIPDLPHCFQNSTWLLSGAEKQQCQCAFEADVINLLAGSLAEAKYVANRDGEVFNANLIYLGALKFYGGAMDLLTVDEYLDCLFPDNEIERKQKQAELFLAAYGFVNNPDNWRAITALAEGLYNSTQDIVSCEELLALLDSAMPARKNVQSVMSVKDVVQRMA
jgi:hypothetical protein